ncbi:MAG: hypothetical protein QOD99_1122 [Chthoniobacter sp.]|nr:hypothetical protein [Chthoniobacter sp.]
MTFRTFTVLLLGIVTLRANNEIDPRAIEFSVVRPPAEKTEPDRYLRRESTYSIVVRGDNALRRSPTVAPSYRLLGIDRDFSFPELKAILTEFYATFPLNAEVADDRLGGRIPFPNIIYIPGEWNERTKDGPELADALSRQYGVGLFYCQFNAYIVDIKECKREDVPTYDQACRDYYLERLNAVIKANRGSKKEQPEPK